MTSAQTKNALFLRLLKGDVFLHEKCLRLWDSAAKQPAFPQQLADAFSSAGDDVNVVLEFVEQALKNNVASRIDEVLPVIGDVIGKLDTSSKAHLHWSHMWVDVLHAYAARVGAESEDGQLALAKLDRIVRREVFERGNDFFNLANGLAIDANGTEPIHQAMATIWKNLMIAAYQFYCLNSSNRSIGAKYVKESAGYPMLRERILEGAGRYLNNKGAIADAARAVIETCAAPAMPASQPGQAPEGAAPSGMA